MIKRGAMDGNIKPIEVERITRIFEFDNKLVKDVMLPVNEVFMIDIDKEADDILEMMVDKKHTRVPVFHGDRNNVIGILHMKDVFELTRVCDVTRDKLAELLHDPFETGEYMVIDQLFLRMQEGGSIWPSSRTFRVIWKVSSHWRIWSKRFSVISTMSLMHRIPVQPDLC